MPTMMLSKLKYREFPGEENEWTLDHVTLSQINLLVGKNATGKTRSLNVIYSLSQLLSGERQDISQSSFEAIFDEGGTTKWKYLLEFDKFAVTQESLQRNDEKILHRGPGGIGRILAEGIKGRPMIKFQLRGNILAVVAKRDEIQHPFLQPILDWATSIRLFRFGSEMNRAALALVVKGVQADVNERATAQVVPIFNKGVQEFKKRYTDALIADMQFMGYDLETIAVRQPSNFTVQGGGTVVGISVKERDLRCWTDQTAISAGMFSVLSLLAQANYYAMAKRGGCILIDDIGENLDYERSCAIIELLRKKANDAPFQLVMSTNNRFVMNVVPLEEWCLLQRDGCEVQAKNWRNARKIFERFKLTGLNNFDFLRYDFVNENPDTIFDEPSTPGRGNGSAKKRAKLRK
jgi:hypothetical protein